MAKFFSDDQQRADHQSHENGEEGDLLLFVADKLKVTSRHWRLCEPASQRI
ncbi:MAG: hypothetical protein R3C49_08575 [Planctomycetaceae bacterium]